MINQSTMDREYILNNVSELSAQQLAEAIQSGVVTLQELRDTSELDATKRNAIKRITSAVGQVAEQEWLAVNKDSKSQLLKFIQRYPSNAHVAEAEAFIAQHDDREFERRQILERLRLNPNTYSPAEILNFIENGTITRTELTEVCAIPESAIDNLSNITAVDLNLGAPPESIPEGYTEVYFWGGPGSGKTCALGAVLQMAEFRKCLTIATGPGYGYATQLKNIFSHDNMANDYLPSPSPVDSTQYLPFSLQLPEEKKSRSVSLIELSGEIFECFYWKNAGKRLPTQSHENTFKSLNSFLSSKNRKLHFFFIDAGRDNRRDERGLTQGDYLQATATYFKGHQLFDKTTDAIYVVLTKSDLLVDESGNHVADDHAERVKYAKKYLEDQRYGAFITALKNICKEYSINGGKLTVEPFSLGKVYFKQICNFEGTSASRLVDILLERVPGTKKSILDFFNA